MEYITAAVSALEVALFWGMMIIVLLMFLTLISIVGIGFVAVYFLNKLFLLARKPAQPIAQDFTTIEEFTVPYEGADVKVRYMVHSDGSFGGLQGVVDQSDSRSVSETLSSHAIEAFSELASLHWETRCD